LLLAGRRDEAAEHADRALEQSRRRGERGHEAWALRLQADVAASRASPAHDVAHERFGEALALARALEMRPLEARCHLGLAALHHAHGRADEARAAADRATQMFRDLEMGYWLARAEAVDSGTGRSTK
jgi:tetratricopeptide (TPR) repeat protein